MIDHAIIKENSDLFLGPVFIIGMPRSGTKLLRNLMNNHSGIRIPKIETNFLHHWVQNWSKFGNLSKKPMFDKFYQKVTASSYFRYMAAHDRLIDCNTWFIMCQNFKPSGVFEALIRHDAAAAFDSTKIWGDKSPSYIRYIPLLKTTYPNARFIHIIRDVRDYCLSMQKAWNKNMIRAAQRWNDDVQKARIDGQTYPEDYFEIRYEELISDHELTLRKICSFLSIHFEESMLQLSEPTENFGDARFTIGVKKDNKEKYSTMNFKIRSKIESIAAFNLKSLGYPTLSSNTDLVHISKQLMLYYKFLDAKNLLIFEIKEQGFCKASINLVNGFKLFFEYRWPRLFFRNF